MQKFIEAGYTKYIYRNELNKACFKHGMAYKDFKDLARRTSFKDNIWGADLADMQSISKFNKGFNFLLCAFDIFSKYGWVVPLEYKKGVTIVNAF